MHLGGHDGTGEDTATDGDHAGERALLVDVGTLDSGLGGTETQTNILIPSPGAGVLARTAGLVVEEDVRLSQRISIRDRVVVAGLLSYLLLESALRLDTDGLLAIGRCIVVCVFDVRELGSHGCCRWLVDGRSS